MSEDTCSICLNNYRDDENTYILEACNHKFHTKCIIDWFRHASSCPYCRDNTVEQVNTLPAFVLRERAKELRKISRCVNAPKDLKKLVERVKKTEQKLKEKNNELKEYRKENKEILSKERKLLQAKYNLQWAKTKNERLVGIYHSNSYPLPNLIVNNFEGIPI
jgi:septal ring factor EnvC (AmiA/AmiB activator)